MPVTIRPMTARDVDPAADVLLRGEWGDRRLFFAWAVDHPRAHPFVADVEGEIAGTAVGTANGPAGWIGAVFVDPAHRGGGIGRELTDRVIGELEAAGCATLVLVATTAGRPMYERLGFRHDTDYHAIEADSLDGGEPALTPWRPADLAGMIDLDARATGEDRAHLLRAFASPASSSTLRGAGGDLKGFVVRAPWGGGATVALTLDDGIRILEARRQAARPGARVRAGLLAENHEAIERLAELRWQPSWTGPRLIRGPALAWQPTRIWGQFNFAIG
jgi:GNAT superfamily N-acetyltransferase